MKHTLALVLMVFGLVGCGLSTTSYTIRDGIRTYNPLSPNYSSDVESYYRSLDIPKAKAVPVKANGFKKTSSAGYELHIIDGGDKYSTQDEANNFVLNKCAEFYLSKCLLVYEGNNYVWSQNQKAYQNTSEVKELLLAQEKTRQQRIDNQYTRAKQQEAFRKEKILADLNQRCLDLGFTGESNIFACIQREAQHDKELAMQRLELQRTYAQNLTEPVDEEEDIPFLIKFLGDIVIGVADAYADPAFQRDLRLQKQINDLNRQRLLDSINN
ncbi:hypothetical protein N8299_04595 [Gammaproteobacteria bacterium]|nr:hypothetical protein [Gammaproteobacteria bacterium]